MKSAYSLILVGAFAFAAVFGLRPNAISQTATSETPKWEYKAFNHSGYPGIEISLNTLGAHGWELVAVSPATGNTQAVYFLKRRKQP